MVSPWPLVISPRLFGDIATAVDDITMAVMVTVDATDSIADITETNSKIVEEFEDDGFSIDSESISMNLFLVN